MRFWWRWREGKSGPTHDDETVMNGAPRMVLWVGHPPPRMVLWVGHPPPKMVLWVGHLPTRLICVLVERLSEWLLQLLCLAIV